jgi:hypothetical protein
MRAAALTFGARGVATRRRTVVATFVAAVFTGAFFVATVLGAGLPILERYFFFLNRVDGAVVFFVAGAVVAPRHTPTATSAANPTLVNEIIL